MFFVIFRNKTTAFHPFSSSTLMDLTPDPNQRLKQAINSIEAPPFLEARIRNQVFQQKPRSVWNIWLMPATAAMALCFGMGVAYQLGHLRLTEASQESYVATLTSKVTRLMSVGLGGHNMPV